ncbi:ubiquitin-like-specific protease 1D isoform X1 [Rosa rugosa]|uniref:ubiquitin-like-specific protease 1D isoform X1 n=1 Tax=Rosa rugosa TaxID=74645 RepID=UPI002B403788|nr:ubiquitin-like-specific protease 1D isoform X1 [Rosa rugosa]
MEGERAEKKRQLDLDFNKLLEDNDDSDPPEVLRVKKPKPIATTAAADEPPAMSGGDQQRDEELEKMNNNELEGAIKRQVENLKRMGSILPDKGEKLRICLKKLEDEQGRRRLERSERGTSKGEKPTRATSSAGVSNGFRDKEATSPPGELQSSFNKFFSKKLDDNQKDCSKGNAFERELSTLGHCNRQKRNNNGEFLQKGAQKGRSSSRHLPSQSPSNFYRDKDRSFLSNGDRKGRASSNNSGRHGEEDFSSSFAKREEPYQLRNRDRNRKSQTILLVDEEEPEFMDTTEQIEEIPESMKDSRIYYPSRDDPHSVEICYTDTKCLDPQSYLTSAIMNFYIRYLHQQASPTDRGICAFHFFNTFFYNKLKDAVSEKGTNKDSLFVKLRRWWKGVDIFQKAYILIPINEDVHWSLVIICIPDKEEESGPFVLHLDSLGLHCSKSIFRIIKSFLKEEWCYLDEEVDISDLTVSDCWKRLPDHIEEKKLVVPQQKNDYDCGLFVLLFMERFIEEAPKRLKKKDLARFGRQWFQPVEASRLRSKIRKLLKEEFQNASKSNCSKESSPLTDASED